MVFFATGLSAEGDTVVSGDQNPAGAATVEQALPAPAEHPKQPDPSIEQEAPAREPSQAPVNPTPTEGVAGNSSPKPPDQSEPDAVEPRTDHQPSGAMLTGDPSDKGVETGSGNLPVAIPDPAGDGQSVPQSAEGPAEGDVDETVAAPTETAPPPEPIEPDFVRALTGIAAGRNDSNPVWSPSGEMIAFERSIGDNREIIVARNDGAIIQRIQCRPTEDKDEMEFFMPGIVEETSYNAGISWSPDENRLVFMSNGGSGNYDLYLLPVLGKEKTVRLTNNTEKDSHPHWSPIDERLAFVSGRTGKAEVYLMDLASRQVSVVTNGTKTYLYPQWSPDGSRLALMYGSNENHDIYLIEDLQNPTKTMKPLTSWEYDDLRPAWSPDGSKLAFYSNYNPAGDPKIWSIIVVPADGSGPTDGEQLAARVVAYNVVPDVERGPAWMPDNRRIVFVRNDPKAYNPIFITNIDEPSEIPLRTETKMNHDVVCSKTGILAFRSQTEQWDHIYIAKLKEEVANREPQ
jgi:Tol biopolymer transport system component